jgi:glycosyltransferase involved in cell wall biosynthesis
MAIPRVSVVMTVYNQAAYVAEALDSVLAQGVAGDVIVVDDGSTDDSLSVVRGFGDRVKVVARANGGLGRARNMGVEESRGDCIAFCDADDLQRPYRLAAQAAVLHRFDEVALVFGDLAPFRDGEPTGESSLLRERVLGPLGMPLDQAVVQAFSRSYSCGALEIPVPSSLANRSLYCGRVPGLIATAHLAWGGASMIRREVFLASGGFPERWPRYVDWALASRVAQSYPLAFLDLPVLDYRLHADQMTGRRDAGIRSALGIIQEVWLDHPIWREREATAVHRHLADLYWQLGHSLRTQGAHREALNAFLASVQANPKQKRVYWDLVRAIGTVISYGPNP